MATKIGPSNQHEILHGHYGQHDCCLCRVERERDALLARLRATAQILIEYGGADGPMNAEHVAVRVIERAKATKAKLETAQEIIDTIMLPIRKAGCPEFATWDQIATWLGEQLANSKNESVKRRRTMMKKKRIEVEQVEVSGLASMLGERVLLMCANYFYEGVLEGIDDNDVMLTDAGIIYETGAWDGDSWKDRQQLPDDPHFVTRQSIESYRLSRITP